MKTSETTLLAGATPQLLKPAEKALVEWYARKGLSGEELDRKVDRVMAFQFGTLRRYPDLPISDR
jgi:hypothetical protein